MLIFTWLIYIFTEAKIQQYLIERRKWKPNYLQLFIIRGMAAILHGAAINVADINHYATSLHQFQVWQYKQAAALLLFQTSTFWIFFDLTLNYLRERPWDYRGKTSGWLDRTPYTMWITAKVGAFWVMILSAIYYINHL